MNIVSLGDSWPDAASIEDAETHPPAPAKQRPAPPQDDEPDAPVDAPGARVPREHAAFDYFLNIGFVHYNRDCMLLDRQVLQFCHVAKDWVRPDVRFVRHTIRMHTTDADHAGTPVLDNRDVPRVGEFAELDRSSYVASLAPDSVVGFTGSNYNEERGGMLAEDATNLLSNVRYGAFAVAGTPALSSRGVWPSFFGRCKPDAPGAVEMYDMDAKAWVWMLELEDVAPIAVGCPRAMALWELEKLKGLFHRYFQLIGPLYIGMRGIRAAGSLRLTGELASADRPKWFDQRIHTAGLSALLGQGLKIDAWAFPCPHHPDSLEDYEERVLNARVRTKIDKMLGIASLLA